MDEAETVPVDAVALKTSSTAMMKRHTATLVLPSAWVTAKAGTAGESDEETWFAYLGFRLVYFFVLAVIYEMIKHRLRTV